MTFILFIAALAVSAPPPADVLVSIRGGRVTAPDSIQQGWKRVRVEEDGAGHILVIFRLPTTTTDAEVARFLAALDTARATPQPGLALGGPEIGDTGEVVVQFTPGRYVLGCVRRGSGGHRHASTGEFKVVVVTTAPSAAGRVPPVATQDVELVDFAYVGPEQWPAGSHLLRIRNRGQQDHQLRLDRLRAGSSLKDWIDAEGSEGVGTPIAGMARMGPGTVGYLPVQLSTGKYVVYCLITDPASGRQHVEMGMLRAIQVE